MSSAAAVISARESTGADSAPRLPEIHRSWNPLVWLATAVYRSVAGDPIPVRVIFARAPRLIIPHLLIVGACEYLMSLDRRIRAMARVHGSRVNSCSFCDNLETRLALAHKLLTREEIDELAAWRDSTKLTAREKAALAYVEEITTTRTSSDETFATLRRHFSEREVVELTFLNAVGNYLNLQAKPIRLAPEGACAIPRKPGIA
jgi:AhpD family alkylhydroperoxidase